MHKTHLFLYTATLSILSGCSYHDIYENENSNHNNIQPVTSIFMGTDRHECGDGNNLTALLQVASSNMSEVKPTLIFLGGDYVGKGPDRDSLGHPTFNMSDVSDEVSKAMGNSKYEELFTYGSHDIGANEGYKPFFSGPHARNGYYVYGISYAQMVYANDSTMNSDSTYIYEGLDLNDAFGCNAEVATGRFTAWVNSLSDHSPIIMLTHVPMHARRNDNHGGELWFDAISKAAENHSIALFFGHNHTLGERGDSTDQSVYLLNTGDSISVQGQDSVYQHKLNFTYGNAGYIKLGYSSLLTFKDTDNNGKYDRLVIRRYSINADDASKIGSIGKLNSCNITLKE